MQLVLEKIGLTKHQAQAYLYLLHTNGSTPPEVARELKLTRTNAYKLLDSLVDISLARRQESNKKLTYFAEDPVALSSLVAGERNKVIAMENATKEAISNLQPIMQKIADMNVKSYKGKKAVLAAYESQAQGGKDLYFIRSRADIPFMGYEDMDYARGLSQKYGNLRHGITSDSPEAPINPTIDKRSNLKRTWIKPEDYTSPVEWSLSEDGLDIIVFDKEPRVIQIKNRVVAESFLQIWKLLDKNLRANTSYKDLPHKAKRTV